MSNSFFDWPAFASRFAPRTKARAEDVNAALDLVSNGFEEVETGLALKAPLASPVFTGAPTAPSPAISEDSLRIPTTAWVHDLVGSLSVGLPLQTGHADKALFTTGVTSEWREIKRLVQRPILQANAGLTPVSTGESLLQPLQYSTGLGTLSGSMAYGAGLFVTGAAGASTNAASSPDAKTWTLRTMPASKAWVYGSDGASFMAIVASDTAVAKSADGVTWTAATALGGALPASVFAPIKIGGLWIVMGVSANYYTSPDGVVWTARVLPAVPTSVGLRQVGALAWVRTGATTAYTSPDGINWTIRVIANYQGVSADSDGALIGYFSNSVLASMERTTDGITWSAFGVIPDVGISGACSVTVNGVRLIGQSEANGGLFSNHGGGWVKRANTQGAGVFGTGQTSPYASSFRGALGGKYLATMTADYLAIIEPDANIVGLFAP